MAKLMAWLNNYGADVLGTSQGIVASLAAITGLIKPEHLPYWLAANAVLTVLYSRIMPHVKNKDA